MENAANLYLIFRDDLAEISKFNLLTLYILNLSCSCLVRLNVFCLNDTSYLIKKCSLLISNDYKHICIIYALNNLAVLYLYEKCWQDDFTFWIRVKKKSIKAITLHMKMTARLFSVPDINSKPKVTVIPIRARLIEEG